MWQDPAEPPSTELSPSASRWVALAEQLCVCARLLRGVLAPVATRHRLSQSQLCLLLVCRKAPRSGLGQSELARSLAVSPGQLSAQVEQLRAAGLVAGRRGESDRRRQFWRLTPAGRTVVRGVVSDLADWAAAARDHLEADRFAALARLLDQLCEILHHGPAGAGPARAALRAFDPGPSPRGDSLRDGSGPTSEAGGESPRRAAS